MRPKAGATLTFTTGSGEDLHKKYELGDALGKGAFGRVVNCVDRQSGKVL